MKKQIIFDYKIIYDNNDMVISCKKNNTEYYPYKGDVNMSGLISSRNLEKGLIMKTIELRQMSY